MKYFVRAHRSTGMAYVHSKGGKVFTSKDRSDATIFSSKARAKVVADKLNKTAADISANVEAVYWNEAKKNPSRKKTSRKGAPAMAERSARIHRYRKPLVAALKKAIREGNSAKEWEVRQKIRKLDYFMYAPRKGGMRLGRK